jgi:hypothetical protein
MPTLPDGSPLPGGDGWRAAGWLSGADDHERGPVGEAWAHRLFCERLFEACRTWTVNATRGFHPCPLCPSAGPDTVVRARRHGLAALLGHAEVRATGPDGERWAAPTLIYHYVTEHGYRPPAGFVAALTAGSVQAPDPAPVGALRLGPSLGPLAELDPDLHAEVLHELGAGVGITVTEAERFEEPGVWRPVLAWHVVPHGTAGGHAVAFDGTDSWRPAVRGLARR